VEVLEEIKSLSGIFYNPDVINALFEIKEEVIEKYQPSFKKGIV